jgi:hypothetical protein
MLSHESRYFVVVAASAIAGATVAWVPLTSAPLPFRETSSYPIWVLLFAITGAACPIVWTNGRKALSVTPPSGSLVKEIIWYVLFAAIAITVFSVAAIAFFSHASQISHVSPIAVPFSKVRFSIIFLANAVAAAPSSITMYRIGAACRNGTGCLKDLITWRTILQSQLTRLSALVILGTLTTAALRKAVLAVSTAHPSDFPAEYVLVFGAGLTILLFIVYVPSSQRLKQRAQEIVDNKFPVPNVLDSDWQEQMQRRRDLATILKIDETDRDLIQTTLTIGGPLITTIISLLIPTG